MIYLPQRAVFIHIPRAAGNSVTSAIAGVCVGKGIDIILGTGPRTKKWRQVERHIKAAALKELIDEWDDIYKFAINRPIKERAKSVARLIQNDLDNGVHEDPTCPEGWRRVLNNEDENFWPGFMRQTTDWYTKGKNKESLGVEIYEMSEINYKWYEICEKCNIPQCSLPRLNQSKR
jgi:hypothetical protein